MQETYGYSVFLCHRTCSKQNTFCKALSNWGDGGRLFTNPLQGSLFIKLCNFIMGAEYADGDHQTHRSVLDEDAGSQHLQADLQADLEADNSTVKKDDNCEPMGIAVGIENDSKAESDNDHMKENVQNKNTYGT